jgi:Gram-negative bacterial TonB protein C-terminal
MKLFFGTVLFAALVAVCAAHARAAAEFCPASIVSGVAKVDAASYRFRLGAISDRTVSGFVRMQTDKGWFAAPFSGVALKATSQQHNDKGFAFSYQDYLSDDIVIKFPAAVSVRYAYVSQAQTKGETLLDWDKEGSVTCLPTPVAAKATPAPAPALPPISKTAIAIAARAIDAPLDAKCDKPFADVELSKAGLLHVPSLFAHDNFTQVPEGTAGVVVAVERDGSVVDAWLWESSGTPLLDKAAMDQARKSTFVPGRAFCRNVPGYFLLRSEFKD